jgi:hypothetical protein
MECLICSEEIKEEEKEMTLSCHSIHLNCVIKSGKEECPVCFEALNIPENLKVTLEESRTKRNKQVQEINEEASRELAIQLQEGSEPHRQSRSRSRHHLVLLGHREVNHRLIHEWDRSGLLIDLCRINQTKHRETIECHSYSIRTAQLMYKLKELCIEMGLSFREVMEYFRIIDDC